MSDTTSLWLSLIQVVYDDKKRLFRHHLHKFIWRSFQDIPPNTNQPFLFSISNTADKNGIYCYVQSKREPNWSLTNNCSLHPKIRLATPGKSKLVTIPTQKNNIYSFNIEVSPVKNIFQIYNNRRGKKQPMLHVVDIDKWFMKTSKMNGFSPLQYEIFNKKILVRKSDAINAIDIPLASCDITGTLKIDQPKEFSEAILTGIGPKKSFGFGMLKLSKNSFAI